MTACRTDTGRYSAAQDLWAEHTFHGLIFQRSENPRLYYAEAMIDNVPAGRSHFFVSPAMGIDFYLAVIDDFGNLVEVPGDPA